MKFGIAIVGIALFCLVPTNCRKDKLIETAKGNAMQYGLARCECEKLQRQKPPGDTTLCSEQMQQAKRYLMFNFEMGKFSESQKAEVLAFGEKVYENCMQETSKP